MNITALIPARSGSKRIPNKNIRKLDGIPLIGHTIKSAKESNIFDQIIVVTDSEEYAEISKNFGAKCPCLRPKIISTDKSPDIEWVLWSLKTFNLPSEDHCIAILRPTSPFRKSETYLEAWKEFNLAKNVDSLRAISEVNEHPGKMWTINGNLIYPLLPFKENHVPWHSCQKPVLPKVYIQNASLEIVKVSSVLETNTISGNIIIPYLSKGFEGFDINNELDFFLAEELIKRNLV